MTALLALLFGGALLAGAVGGFAGFGLGSLLTPLVAAYFGTKLAVAAVTIPHIAANGLRFWTLRRHVDRHVLRTFGIPSALGGVTGALLHAVVTSRLLTIILALLLILTGAVGATGKAIRFGRRASSAGGALSGLLGGLVGSQGPVRAGAMLGFGLSKESFVATSTAIALIVDVVRIPVYVVSVGGQLQEIWLTIGMLTAGALAGTLLGRALLGWMREGIFRRAIAVLLIILGIALLLT